MVGRWHINTCRLRMGFHSSSYGCEDRWQNTFGNIVYVYNRIRCSWVQCSASDINTDDKWTQQLLILHSPNARCCLKKNNARFHNMDLFFKAFWCNRKWRKAKTFLFPSFMSSVHAGVMRIRLVIKHQRFQYNTTEMLLIEMVCS